MEPLVVDAHLTIPGEDLVFVAVRASGPGGQNVNKVASKVELRFDLDGTHALTPAVKARLRALARLDEAGRVMITSQKTRDQRRNLEDAREKLAELVRRALFVPPARRATRPTGGSVKRRLEEKRRRGQAKAHRRAAGD